MDLKDIECFKCHKKGHYANKCPDAKGKDGKGFFKVRQLEEPFPDKKDEKSIRQIRIRHSDLNRDDPDPFLRYWIKIYDLAGPVRDTLHPGYLTHVFVDTGANCNTISRRFFDDLVGRGLVSEFIKGPNEGVRINLVGGQSLVISGDKVKMEVDVATNMGIKTSIQDFLIWRWLLELSHFEIALSIFALCIRTLVGIVPFLVALETFDIREIHCLPRT